MKEKWYGTDYNESLLDKEAQINRWTKCMQGDSEWATQVFLPKKNPFVATDFTLREKVKTESVEGDVAVKAVPQLIEYITTEVTEVVEEVEDEIVVTTDDVKVVVEAETETGKEADKEGDDEEGEEEEEEEPGGQLPVPAGKVWTTRYC